MDKINIHKDWRNDLLDILENGVSDSKDLSQEELIKTWPLVKHLLDNESIECQTAVGGYIFKGVTIKGQQYKEQLQKELIQKRNINNAKANKKASDRTHKYWYNLPIGTIGIGVIIGVLTLMVAYIFRTQLGIPL